jgi:hypothetical protein
MGKPEMCPLQKTKIMWTMDKNDKLSPVVDFGISNTDPWVIISESVLVL